MPTLTDLDQVAGKLAILQRLSRESGRPGPTVTGLTFKLDERLLGRCAELGFQRCVVLAPADDLATLRPFLDRCAAAASRVGS